ncbi:hypothetical protein Pyrde_0074 [Pyrodictium delaneyi]|uniref:Ribbon-helix-helix protein CopG domain-containing protein n=1 Tax=Pyrodictium delaneyi TaxID=1273541 RepID=A0A0P0N1Y9_9CREN|nr:ribbon-helix-helix protein, CopG family [Pyrodictium delaneyi]ALL00124.1 hypothetical protein Pyrde_0074 [Pyrodictium delaneyi]
MPRPKIGRRVTVSLPPELYEKIENYRKKEHLTEMSEAIRRLLYKAIEIEEERARAVAAATTA